MARSRSPIGPIGALDESVDTPKVPRYVSPNGYRNMQSRPYPDRDGKRVWLSRDERRRLLELVEEEPRRRLAFSLASHGLRSDELVGVSKSDVRDLDGAHVLAVDEENKTGTRELPIGADLAREVRRTANMAQLRKDEPVVDVSTRSLRNWIRDAREELVDELGEEVLELGMHDLRRSWATDTYYSLAFAGVPIAEELVLSWGGWEHSSTGVETFRQNYLGPVPEWLVEKVASDLELPA